MWRRKRTQERAEWKKSVAANNFVPVVVVVGVVNDKLCD